MKRIESFLNSTLYIVIIYAFALLTWTIRDGNDTVHTFGLFNMIGIFTIIFFLTLTLVFFKNTKYAIPLLTSLLFVINNSEISFDTLSSFGFPYIVLALLIIGPTIYIIRFKPKFQFKALTLGFLLMAIAYLIPLIFTEVSLNAIAISGVGILYFLIYLFISNTSKGSIDYFFKMLVIMNLLMVAEFGVVFIRMIIAHSDLSIIEAIRVNNASWGYLGWTGINDLAYYLVFTLPGYVYYIFKKPKNFVFWILLLLPASVIILIESRSGYFGLSLVTIGLGFLIIKHGKHHIYFNAIFAIITTALVGYLSKDILIDIYEGVLATISGQSINSFTSSRLWIYTRGLEIFEASPLFGQGWMSIEQLNGSHLYMFHSPIIQALATMGIFGLLALLVHYYQVFYLMFSRWSLEMRILFVGYVAVQLHGLVENLQFSVPFSLFIAILFPLIENTSISTVFKKEGRTFIFDSSLILQTND